MFRIPSSNFSLKVVSVMGLSMLAACVSTQTLEAGESQITETPIGQTREAALAQTDGLSDADAQCATVKTGVGVNRRAYFLETCSWQRPAAFSLCGSSPVNVEYTFLEGKLVAAMFVFESGSDSAVQTCISEQAAADGYSVDDTELSAEQTLKLSNTEEKMIIALADGPMVRVYDAELAPRVHLLRDNL